MPATRRRIPSWLRRSSRLPAFDRVAQVIEERPASGDLVREAILTELRELSEAMGEPLNSLDDRNA